MGIRARLDSRRDWFWQKAEGFKLLTDVNTSTSHLVRDLTGVEMSFRLRLVSRQRESMAKSFSYSPAADLLIRDGIEAQRIRLIPPPSSRRHLTGESDFLLVFDPFFSGRFHVSGRVNV